MIEHVSSDEPAGFDAAGAAQDIRDRSRRYAPLHALPGVSELIRLVYRNPHAAPAALEALTAELAKQPERAVSLETPLFPAPSQGRSA